MDSDMVVIDDHQQEEYVLLDLDDVCGQVDIPPGEPYTLSGLDTLNPVLTIGDKLKLIGEYEETIGTCLVFSENGDHDRGSVSKDVLNPYIHGQSRAASKQLKPVTSLQKILKFRLLSEDDGLDSTKKSPDLPEPMQSEHVQRVSPVG